MSTSEILELLDILAWPAVAFLTLVLIRPYISDLLRGSKVTLSIGGQRIETTFRELEQVIEEQAIQPLSTEQVDFMETLQKSGSQAYPNGVPSSERPLLRPLRNNGLVLTNPRNEHLGNAKAIELSGLGRLYLRARKNEE